MSDGRGREVVLLVEDNALIRMNGADTLEQSGYGVIEAANADQALTTLAADQHGVDILVTDIEMPGTMDGRALAREVDRLWPWIRIVITSGHFCLDDRDVPDHGSFVSKPWATAAVLRAIGAAG